MQIEYGKIAYLKMLELEKELSALKNSLTQKTSNDIYLVSENDDNNSLTYTKSFIFNVIESGKYNFYGNMQTAFENENDISVIFYLNGEIVYKINLSSLLDANFNFDVLCQSGKNQLDVVFSAVNVFNLKNISVNISRYEKDDHYHRISHFGFDNYEIIVSVNKNVASVYQLYDNQDELIELFTFNCKDAQVYDAGTNYFAIVYVDENSNLYHKFYSLYSNYVNDTPLNVNSVQSVCGYRIDSYTVKIIYSRFSQIYYCYYTESERLIINEKTSRKGNILYADAQYKGIYFVVDFTSKTKLVIE